MREMRSCRQLRLVVGLAVAGLPAWPVLAHEALHVIGGWHAHDHEPAEPGHAHGHSHDTDAGHGHELPPPDLHPALRGPSVRLVSSRLARGPLLAVVPEVRGNAAVVDPPPDRSRGGTAFPFFPPWAASAPARAPPPSFVHA